MAIGPSSSNGQPAIDLAAREDPAPADEPVLTLADIQGNVIAGFNKSRQTLLYFHIDDPGLFKPAVAELGEVVAKASDVLAFNRQYNAERDQASTLRARSAPPASPSTEPLTAVWVNVAFSFAGLAKLTDDVDQFVDSSFRRGLVEQSHVLGDPQGSPGDPSGWAVRDGDSHDAADVLVIVAADAPDDLTNTVDRVISLVRSHGGATYLDRDDGVSLAGREHFGFRDGVSRPGIRGLASSNATDLLTPRSDPADPNHGRPGQELVWPGEFVFGYPDQNGRLERGAADWMKNGAGFPVAPRWAQNGSFLVFRRLQQNVHTFHQFLYTNRGTDTAAGLGARTVGRWPSGAPIERAPVRDDPSLANDNTFDFPQPPKGFCPGNAHIRKANPRNDLSEDERLRHRLLRRAIPFGAAATSTPDAPGEEDGVKRGLLFLAYMTSIVDQFEFVTTAWINRRDFRTAGVGTDALLGQPGRNWIVPTGGGYYFAPSISALKEALAASR